MMLMMMMLEKKRKVGHLNVCIELNTKTRLVCGQVSDVAIVESDRIWKNGVKPRTSWEEERDGRWLGDACMARNSWPRGEIFERVNF